MSASRRATLPALAVALGMCVAQSGKAQELEPRRWTHLPVGANFFGVGYAFSEGNIFLDSSLLIEDATAEVHVAGFGYTRALDVLGKSARIDLKAPYSRGRWEGIVDGEPASTRRGGFGDPRVRFAVNLLGSPAQTPAEFSQYQPTTIVGVALEVSAPLGEYLEDRLINLGSNRWVFRPQVGVVHNRNRWTFELTGSAWIFTENDSYFGGTEFDQSPMYTLQGHVIYTWRPGLWASFSGGYGEGGRPTIDGVRSDADQGNSVWAASLGLPINRRQGLKIAWVNASTTKATGADYDSLIVAYSYMWGDGL